MTISHHLVISHAVTKRVSPNQIVNELKKASKQSMTFIGTGADTIAQRASQQHMEMDLAKQMYLTVSSDPVEIIGGGRRVLGVNQLLTLIHHIVRSTVASNAEVNLAELGFKAVSDLKMALPEAEREHMAKATSLAGASSRAQRAQILERDALPPQVGYPGQPWVGQRLRSITVTEVESNKRPATCLTPNTMQQTHLAEFLELQGPSRGPRAKIILKRRLRQLPLRKRIGALSNAKWLPPATMQQTHQAECVERQSASSAPRVKFFLERRLRQLPLRKRLVALANAGIR
jgi:hypothetical protein